MSAPVAPPFPFINGLNPSCSDINQLILNLNALFPTVATAGNGSFSGNLAVTGTTSLTGNTTEAGTLTVTGLTTLNGGLAGGSSANIALNTNKFTVNASTGNGLFAGTLIASGITTTPLVINTANVVTVTTNAGTVPVTNEVNIFSNSSNATMAITMAIASAVEGQRSIVSIYDFAGTSETIGWTNTENSTVSVPTTSNGSTTLPITIEFMFNSATSKWRCMRVS